MNQSSWICTITSNIASSYNCRYVDLVPNIQNTSQNRESGVFYRYDNTLNFLFQFFLSVYIREITLPSVIFSATCIAVFVWSVRGPVLILDTPSASAIRTISCMCIIIVSNNFVESVKWLDYLYFFFNCTSLAYLILQVFIHTTSFS